MILLLLLCLSDGPPYFTPPVDPTADVATLRAAIEAGHPDPEPWTRKLQLYTATEMLQEAGPLTSLLAKTFPDNPVFLEAAMILAGIEERYDDALALGEDLVKRFSNHPTLPINLARIYLRTDRKAQGLNLMFFALERGPLRLDDWQLLLRTLAAAHPDPADMLADLEDKCAKNPERKALKYVLMVVLVRFGRLDQARAVLVDNPELAAHDDLQAFIHFAAMMPERPAAP